MAQKKQKKNNRATRLIFLAVIFSTVLLILIGRIFYLQFYFKKDGSALKELAFKQSSASSIIDSKRGTIYDSTGKILAKSVEVDTISVNPSLISVKNNVDETNLLKEKVAWVLSEIFELDYNETLAKLSSSKSVETIASKVEADKVEKLRDWMKTNKIYSGINIDQDTKRYYPYNNLASSLLGFCGSDNTGLAGLEYYWNNILSGTPGRIITSIDASQETIPDVDEDYYAAENGNDISLTIDANIQSVVEKYLKQAVEENDCKNGGSMILMDPSTGDILAMASYPDYNLNSPFEPTEYLLENGWDTMSSEDKTNSLYTLYKNKSVSDTYEPGSVFKIIVASSALEENLVNTDTAGDFYCSGSQDVSGIRISCANKSGHGSESLRNALENSCNPALIQLGQRIGSSKLYKYIEAFGLFDKTGIATSGEANSNFHSLNNVGPIELATTCFGQRFTITPIQMITAAASIANKGVLVQPRIVKSVYNSDTNTTTSINTKTVRRVISEETASKICDMMNSVVEEGGGQAGKVAGYTIGGKTGTSEPNVNSPEDGYVASFLAIAPVENTKVIALLTLYGPQVSNYYGGQIAAPVVSQVLNEVLPYLQVPSNNSTSDNSTNNKITIPDLKGKTISEAKSTLESIGLTYITSSDNDSIVTIQTPVAGVSLEKNGIVALYSDNSTSVSSTVPDLKGKTVSQAKAALKAQNLNIEFSGSGKVVSQDTTAGSSVPQGTVIKVNLQQVTSDQH